MMMDRRNHPAKEPPEPSKIIGNRDQIENFTGNRDQIETLLENRRMNRQIHRILLASGINSTKSRKTGE